MRTIPIKRVNRLTTPAIFWFLGLLAMVTGCATKTEPLHFSGFLDNYSGLRPSPDGSGAWSYRNPAADFKPYDKIMLDPLVIWPNQQSSYGGVDTLTAWKLGLAFQDRMSNALTDGYTIVTDPGPGVLRLRAALTKVMLKRPGLASPGPLLPMAGDVLLQASAKVYGMNALEGEAAIEAELLDATNQERLAAYVEDRVNDRVILTKDKDSLGPVLEIFDYWARKLRQRLDEQRGLRKTKP